MWRGAGEKAAPLRVRKLEALTFGNWIEKEGEGKEENQR